MNPTFLAALQAVHLVRKRPGLLRPLLFAGAGIAGAAAVAYVVLPKDKRDRALAKARSFVQATLQEGSPLAAVKRLATTDPERLPAYS